MPPLPLGEGRGEGTLLMSVASQSTPSDKKVQQETHHVQKILLPVDLQETKFAEQALQAAIAEARSSGGKITIMTVLPGFGMPVVASFFPKDAMKKALEEVKTQLSDYLKKNVPDDIRATASIAEGNPWEKIVSQANKIKADLIILPSHDRKKVDQILLGSCAAKVAEHAKCSVLVIRAADK